MNPLTEATENEASLAYCEGSTAEFANPDARFQHKALIQITMDSFQFLSRSLRTPVPNQAFKEFCK